MGAPLAPGLIQAQYDGQPVILSQFPDNSCFGMLGDRVIRVTVEQHGVRSVFVDSPKRDGSYMIWDSAHQVKDLQSHEEMSIDLRAMPQLNASTKNFSGAWQVAEAPKLLEAVTLIEQTFGQLPVYAGTMEGQPVTLTARADGKLVGAANIDGIDREVWLSEDLGFGRRRLNVVWRDSDWLWSITHRFEGVNE